jgi:hypothetical protein
MQEFTVTINIPDDMSSDRLEKILLDALYKETILSGDLDVKEIEITGLTPENYYNKLKRKHRAEITKLEKERAIGVYHFTVDEYKAHKLEQQAIGAYESVWFCKFEGVRTDEQPNRHISHLLNARVKELRNQAKTLREQGNE